MTATIPREAVRAATILARSTGVDLEDAISFAAEAWWRHPDDPSKAWVRTRNKCVDEQRHRHGDTRRMRVARSLVSLDVSPDRGEDDPELSRVEDRVLLADIIASLPDDELAALARYYWLGLPLSKNGPDRVVELRAMRHARAAAVKWA